MLVLATFFPTSDVSPGYMDFMGVGCLKLHVWKTVCSILLFEDDFSAKGKQMLYINILKFIFVNYTVLGALLVTRNFLDIKILGLSLEVHFSGSL